MRFKIALLVVAVLAVGVLPATASAHRNGLRHNYKHVYYKAKRQFGPAAVGRQIVSHGFRTKSGTVRPATKHEIAVSTRQLRRLLHPVPPPTLLVRSAVQPALPPAGVMTAGVAAGGCVGMSAESGSLGYNNNRNPSYVGCYQISKDHFNGGSCSGLGTDPVGQDKCAAIICQTEGAGAWHNAAGQNPCGRLR